MTFPKPRWFTASVRPHRILELCVSEGWINHRSGIAPTSHARPLAPSVADRAQRLYAEQKQLLRNLLESVADDDPASHPLRVAPEIADALHKISGTAAYFGDAELGRVARDLEPPVRSADSAALLRSLCGPLNAFLAQ